MGEALFAIGLANTVFFSTDPNQSRWRLAGYLVLTFAPFLVAGPFIGPVLDRAKGGRKWVIFGAALARAALCLMLLRNLDDFYFYIEAFLMLVFSKVNLISKSALVPTTVRNDEELVEANSKLASLGALSAVAGAILAGIAVVVVKIPFLGLEGGHAQTTAILALGFIAFVLTASQAWQLPKVQVADSEPGEAEKAELASAGIFLAATATGFSRAIMGFLTFLLAFWVKNENRPLVWIGALVGAAQVGYFLGSLLAPAVRRRVPEERMIQMALGALTVASCMTLFLRDAGEGLGGAMILAFTVGMSSNVLKQGFDSLVQRDAPDANRGRSFAKFETRFQLWWAIGALIPVVFYIPLWAGILMIAGVAGFALVTYVLGLYEMTEVVAGRRQPRQKRPRPWSVEARHARRRRRSDDDPRSSEGPVVDPAFAGRPPGAPVGPARVGVVDPTLVGAETGGLFGPGEDTVPDGLYGAPDGGLFDPSAPPPPKGPGYHRGPVAAPAWVGDATGTAEWAAVVPPGSSLPEDESGPEEPTTSGHSELDIVVLEDGTYGYRGALETADPPNGSTAEDPVPGERPGQDTNEIPIVIPPPRLPDD